MKKAFLWMFEMGVLQLLLLAALIVACCLTSGCALERADPAARSNRAIYTITVTAHGDSSTATAYISDGLMATADGEGFIDFKTLDAEAAKRQAALDGLFFIPFSGKHEKGRFTKASFTGLDLSHDRFHMARAVMEGVVFQILWFMEAFGTQPDEKKGITLFDLKIRSFLDAIKEGGVAPVPTSQILYNQAIIDGIAKSAAAGREVEIEIPEI